MRLVIFCHSLVSDWNHGNAHFLRGVATELIARGIDVQAYEPQDAWSLANLRADAGEGAIERFRLAYPELTGRITRYERSSLDLSAALDGADAVLVHEWNDHALVAAVGRRRAAGGRFTLLFHDTHHRSVTDRASIAAYDLRHYDGVLAFGDPIRDAYLATGWAQRAWTWHEAADTRRFMPLPGGRPTRDLVWIGNWGDDERTRELQEFLIEPVRRLGLSACVYGVRYPADALRTLDAAGIEYGGWLANYDVPRVFADFKMTVHVPRRPYVEQLPGIPTIRPFEALACAMPLVSAPWADTSGLFTAGRDYLVARDGDEMTCALGRLRHDADLRSRLGAQARATILARHTCAHRVDQLLAILARTAAAGRSALTSVEMAS